MRKQPHIFTWDQEPRKAPPSEFFSASTFREESSAPPPRPPQRQGRMSRLFVMLAVCVGVGSCAVHGLAQLLHP